MYNSQPYISTMIRRIFTITIGFLLTFTAKAEEMNDSAYMALYRHYYQLFDSDSTEEFYKASEQLLQNYMRKGNIVSYYKIRQNEIFYDATHDNTYKAIMKANDLLEDMKNSRTKHYELPYMSLGYIFETRGTYRMATHYYEEALKNIDLTDSTGLTHIYSELASINITRDTDKAWQWTNRLGKAISYDSLYYKSYLTLKGLLYFYSGDKDNFFNNKREFDDFSERTATLDDSGEHIMKIMEDAFLGKYDEALRLLEQKSQDYDVLRQCDLRIRIYEMMGHLDWAVKETYKRRDIRDSLNNDLLFNNLSEINATINVNKLYEDAAKEREQLLSMTIILLFMALGLAFSRYISHRYYQKKTENQNKQLEKALSEAKESERMKDIFIQHIGHEMSTPLNTITECTQVITDPDNNLDEAERAKIIKGIKQNTTIITSIVDQLLELSLEESKDQRYRDDNETE